MTKLEHRLENAKANMKAATTASQVVKYMNEVARLEGAVRNEAYAA